MPSRNRFLSWHISILRLLNEKSKNICFVNGSRQINLKSIRKVSYIFVCLTLNYDFVREEISAYALFFPDNVNCNVKYLVTHRKHNNCLVVGVRKITHH